MSFIIVNYVKPLENENDSHLSNPEGKMHISSANKNKSYPMV